MSEGRGRRRLASALVEALWQTSFRGVGRLRRSTARPWSSSGGQRVLVVAPHPDDEVIGCGGTLVLHRRAGDRVAVVCVTDGRGQPASRPDPEAYSRRRRTEMERAAAILGLERVDWLGLAEGSWEPEQMLPLLARVLANWSPHLLYLPSQVDFHPDHRKVAHGVALTLGDGGGPLMRVYQVQVPLTSLLVNLVSDTSSVAPTVARALDAYASQGVTARCVVRRWRYAASFHRRSRLVEEFWEMPAARYHSLHRLALERWFTSTYRGLRPTPLTDPLAHLVGRSARRALAGEGA